MSSAKQGWRVIRERGVYKTEKFVNWGGPKPTLATWEMALEAIDSYSAS